MARFDVASWTTASTATTVGVTTGGPDEPAFDLTLTASTAAPNTTQPGISALSVGKGNFSPESVGYASWLQTSAKVTAGSTGVAMETRTTGGTTLGSAYGISGTTLIKFTSGFPAAAAIIREGGFSWQGALASPSISTVAGTTMATTSGSWDVLSTAPPNAFLVLGRSAVSSVASFSLGFACKDTAGVISQWSISQCGREASSAHVHRSASTASVLKLHTTGTTSHDVAVTSFKTSGVELTVNASDTARAGSMTAWKWRVPKANAGSVVTTDLDGTTLITVTGLGPNVGLVIVASIDENAGSLIANNAFSVGFMSSNGKQRSVAGFVRNAGTLASDYKSYFNTTGVVTALDTAGISYTGVGTITSDGFSISFGPLRLPENKRFFWAALSNVVTDISANILSSGAISANSSEVQRISAAFASSFAVSANSSEVQRISAAINSSFTLLGNVEPEFFPGEGKHHSYSRSEIEWTQKADLGLGRGLTEESWEHLLVVQENSSSPDLNKTLNLTTARTRVGLAEYGNAKFLRIIPPSTNPHPLRLSGDRGGAGMQLSSRGMSILSIGERSASDAYLFTTSTSGVPDVRVLID